jgi:hypothetical protein
MKLPALPLADESTFDEFCRASSPARLDDCVPRRRQAKTPRSGRVYKVHAAKVGVLSGMTAGSFGLFLERYAVLPSNLAARRSFIKETYHTALQILADPLYPVSLTETLPRLPFDPFPDRERLLRWWRAFQAWLGTLQPIQRTALDRQIVLWQVGPWETAKTK